MKTGLEGLEEAVLPLVAKPGRYLAPVGFRPLADFDAARLRVCVLAPDPMDAAAAEPGFHALLLTLRRAEALGLGGLVADLSTGVERDLAVQLREQGVPAFSFITRRALGTFDLLLIPASDILQVSRGLGTLGLAGIPLRVEHRGEDAPVVLVTGDAAWYPESLTDFVDGFYLGDPEVLVAGLSALGIRRGPRGDRRELLFRLSELDGMVVPAFGSGAGVPARLPEGRWLTALPPWEGTPLLPLIGTGLEGALLEIARPMGPACPVSPPRPLRWRPVEDVLRGAEWVTSGTGEGTLLLGGVAAGGHPELARVLETLGLHFGPAALQLRLGEVDAAQLTQAAARELQKSREAELVVSAVAVSASLREAAGRQLSGANLAESIEIALRGEWPGVRARYVVGMPGETRRDREEGLELLEQLSLGRDRGPRRPRLSVELCPFVPVRLTPWESAPGVDLREWAELVAAWRRRLSRAKVRVLAPSPVPAVIESFLRGAGAASASVLPELAAFWEQLPPDPDGAARAWEEFRARVATRLDEPGRGAPRLALGLAGEPVPGRAETEWGIGDEGQAAPRAVPRGDEGGRRPRRGSRVRDDRRAERFRLRAAKTEPVRFISHLDLGRAFLRAFRRSQLPLAVTGGKDRRPKLAFGPPLPLGMTSTAEFLDVIFSKEVPESFVRDLNQCLPEGLAVLASAPIRTEPASLSSAIQFATYEVSFPDALIDRYLDGMPFDTLRARLLDRVDLALAGTTFTITKGRGDARKTFNARPSLLRAEVVRDDGGRPALSLALTLNGPDSARPELWTAALLDRADVDERLLRVHRSGLFIPGHQKWLDPLDVVAPGFEWWRQPVRGGTVL